MGRDLVGAEALGEADREPLGEAAAVGEDERRPVLLDERGEVTGTRYGVFGPPTVYVLDRDGRLLARGVGPRDWSSPAARRLLEAVLEQPGGRR